MLETLDLIIAFSVIMTVLSLVITIIVQMLSTVLALRGKNLANALALTFQTIDPKIGDRAHALAARILKDPIFTDSLLAPKDRPELAISPEAAALIVAEKAYRKATADLAKAPDDPNLKAAAEAAAQDVRTRRAKVTISTTAVGRRHPWRFLSRDAMHLGTAIRPGEVYRVLQEWGAFTTTEAALRGLPPELVQEARRLLHTLAQRDQPAAEAMGKLQALARIAGVFTSAEEKQAVVNALGHLGTTVERATTQAYDRFQRWFGSAQDRAEQWFQIHIRTLTMIAAALMAVLLQLDSLEILQKLRTSPQIVRALVDSAAPVVVQQGAVVLDPTDTAAYAAYKAWLAKHPLYALESLPTSDKAEEYRTALRLRFKNGASEQFALSQFDDAAEKWRSAWGAAKPPPEGETLKAAYEAWVKQFPAYTLDPVPDWSTAKSEEVKRRLVERLRRDHGSDTGSTAESQAAAHERWLREYDAELPAASNAFIRKRGDTLHSLVNEVEKAGFDLVPTAFWSRWDHEPVRWRWLWPWLDQFCAHAFGMFVTAGLLTLGAPFWFNLLKNLMNLRPAVARLVERRPQSAPALPSAPVTAPPSS